MPSTQLQQCNSFLLSLLLLIHDPPKTSGTDALNRCCQDRYSARITWNNRHTLNFIKERGDVSASYQERGLAALKGLSGENGQATDLSNIREPHTPNITIWPRFAHPSPGLFLFVSLFISLSVSLQTTTSPCTLNSLSSSLFVSSASLSLAHTSRNLSEIFQEFC